jgi:hypothetical protein
VGLLVALRPKDRSPAPPGKEADPQEYPGTSSGREAKPQAETVRRLAVIGDRRFRVERCVKAH